LVYNCCWLSPAQSFSSPSPAGPFTIFYCLRFETPPTWMAWSLHLYPLGTGCPVITPGTGFHFHLFLRPAGLRWTYSNPPPSGEPKTQSQIQRHIATDGQSISKFWCLAQSEAHVQIFITLRQLQSCFSGATSLTRRRVCLLYMLLALTSVVFLGSESLGTRDHILLPQI
jgi:hypothetical protein